MPTLVLSVFDKTECHADQYFLVFDTTARETVRVWWIIPLEASHSIRCWMDQIGKVANETDGISSFCKSQIAVFNSVSLTRHMKHIHFRLETNRIQTTSVWCVCVESILFCCFFFFFAYELPNWLNDIIEQHLSFAHTYSSDCMFRILSGLSIGWYV